MAYRPHPGLTTAARLAQYTEVEGGVWRIPPEDAKFHERALMMRRDDCGVHCYPFEGAMSTQAVHSMRFSDGREWDCVNGWRDMSLQRPSQRRIDRPCE